MGIRRFPLRSTGYDYYYCIYLFQDEYHTFIDDDDWTDATIVCYESYVFIYVWIFLCFIHSPLSCYCNFLKDILVNINNCNY